MEFYLYTCFQLSFHNLVTKMSLPAEKTLKKWKEEVGWLRITKKQKMICTICCSQEEIIRSMPNV